MSPRQRPRLLLVPRFLRNLLISPILSETTYDFVRIIIVMRLQTNVRSPIYDYCSLVFIVFFSFFYNRFGVYFDDEFLRGPVLQLFLLVAFEC